MTTIERRTDTVDGTHRRFVGSVDEDTDPQVRSRRRRRQRNNSHQDRQRIIRINKVQREKYVSNNISTAKYNAISFFPKFLFEQFRRYANVFFLCIGLLQQIPNVSPTGRFVTVVPFSVILGLTAIKELIEDFKRHRADDRVNNSGIDVLDPEKIKFNTKSWKHVKVGDMVRVVDGQFFPADLVLISSSEPQGMCHIETSNLDGETNLKIKSALPATCDRETTQAVAELKGTVECEPPNRNLDDFKGNVQLSTKTTPISPSTLLLRGSKLMNTAWIYGLVIYTGHETKLLMNSTKAPLKRSNIDKITNYQIVFLFLVLIVISLLSAAANEVQESGGLAVESYLGGEVSNHFFYNFLTFVILYNNLIPISLQVTLEFVKFTQAYFINWDPNMYHEETDTPALARTSNLNEELGQIKYIFSDKTGTLTKNVMEFKKCSIAGALYTIESPDAVKKDLAGDNKDLARTIDDFLMLMAVCHSVIPEHKEDGEFCYSASSPDEKALVEGAAIMGYEFIERKPESVVIKIKPRKGQTKEYEILEVIEFNSTRKRMTVIVREPKTGKIRLLCKGADSMIMERLSPTSHHKDVTNDHLEHFAREGLRTLCIAARTIDDEEFDKWREIYHSATTDLTDKKDDLIDAAAELIEKDLELLGATAIEDKLQDGVPEAIARLLEANIHIWVLTGDKQETAINIGHSCRLIKENMPVIVVNTLSLDETRDLISSQMEGFRKEGVIGQDNEVALVIDSKSLTFALDHSLRQDFLDLCQSCQSVICCRVSPLQKAEVVELVQENTGAISLAIGDGANDVAMIQKADVGVGISGNEGLQAANSSDFAIAQFRFLTRLLFVHGAWNYTRVSKVILYSFYKNICLYIIELWFAIYNYWSGQVIFERWTIGLYNVFFTFLAPIAIGVLDQFCTAETRMEYPTLYHSSQRSDYFNHKIFWLWMANSIAHSMVLFWIPITYYSHDTVWGNGLTGDYLVVGNMVYTYVVVTVCLKAGLEMESWSWISHASVWGSMAIWFIFLGVYSYFWPVGIPLAPGMAGMAVLVYTSPTFWLGLFVVPFATLLPDIAYKVVKVSIFTTEADKIRIAEIKKQDVAPYVSSSGRRKRGLRSMEATSMLSNAARVFTRGPKRRRPKLKDEEEAKAREKREEQQRKEDIELQHGYAFSQEEGGAVSQVEYIRRYDTTLPHNQRSARSGAARLLDEITVNVPSFHPQKPMRPHDSDYFEKSLLGGSHSKFTGLRGQRGESTTAEIETKEDNHPKSSLTVRARHAELPSPQSPKKIDVQIVTKTKTNKRYAQNNTETVPLSSSFVNRKGEDSV